MKQTTTGRSNARDLCQCTSASRARTGEHQFTREEEEALQLHRGAVQVSEFEHKSPEFQPSVCPLHPFTLSLNNLKSLHQKVQEIKGK